MLSSIKRSQHGSETANRGVKAAGYPLSMKKLLSTDDEQRREMSKYSTFAGQCDKKMKQTCPKRQKLVKNYLKCVQYDEKSDQSCLKFVNYIKLLQNNSEYVQNLSKQLKLAHYGNKKKLFQTV